MASLGEVPGGEVVTYGLAGKYLLFDFWAENLFQCIDCMSPAVDYLQSLGLTLILGHPERIAALYNDPASVDWFMERGVLLQMNTWCLTDPPGSAVYALAARRLREDRYFAFGTDTHNAASMPNRIKGITIAEQLVGKQVVHRLTVENPGQILQHNFGRDFGDSSVKGFYFRFVSAKHSCLTFSNRVRNSSLCMAALKIAWPICRPAWTSEGKCMPARTRSSRSRLSCSTPV